jgi:hypothetical protein
LPTPRALASQPLRLLAAAACRGSWGRCDPRPPPPCAPRAPLGCWGAACVAMARGPRPLPCFPPLVVPSLSQAGLLVLVVVPTRSKRPVLKGLRAGALPSCLARALAAAVLGRARRLPCHRNCPRPGLVFFANAVARGLALIPRGGLRSNCKV